MSDPSASGVYACLANLVRLKHQSRGFSFLPRQPVQSLLAGRHASKLRGRGLNFEEIRRYLPGDDIRQIDWKVTARTRKPHTRVYSEERERPVWLVVDQRLGMFFGSQQKLKSVAAAEVAALGAWQTIAVKDRVGAIIFNDVDVRVVHPQRSQQTVMRILQSVLEMNHALSSDSKQWPNLGMLNEALRRAQQICRHDGLLVLISDGDGDNDETRELLTEISRHNDVLMAFVFDPLEAEMPDVGRVVVSDGARQLEIESDSATLRTNFRDDFAKIRQRGRHFLLTREVPVLPISAAESTVDQLARSLGQQLRRRH